MTKLDGGSHGKPKQRQDLQGCWIALLVAFIACNLIYFVGERNADWMAYQRLFEEDGAWLADRGRDPGFTWLLDVFKTVGSYELLRVAVALYFFSFAAWLINRWRPLLQGRGYLWSYMGLLPLLIPKMTVQIREGLALTLVLIAFTLLFERDDQRRQLKAVWLPIALLGVATSVHGSTILIVTALLFPYVVYRLTRVLGSQHVIRNAALFAATGICIALYVADLDELLREAALSALGDMPQEESETGGFKAVYWTVKCAIVLYLMYRVRLIDFKRPAFALFMRFATYTVIPTLQLAVLFLVFAGYPGFVSSAMIRAYHTVLYVVLALATLATAASRTSGWISIALLLDEYRVMTAALEG